MNLATPARASSLLAALAALLAALAPAVADLDTTSTAGLFGGAVVILGILNTFLAGQRAHEARVGYTGWKTASTRYNLGYCASTPGGGVQPIMGGTMGPSGPGMTAEDDGEDGDDELPAELAGVSPDTGIPPDAIDSPAQTQETS